MPYLHSGACPRLEERKVKATRLRWRGKERLGEGPRRNCFPRAVCTSSLSLVLGLIVRIGTNLESCLRRDASGKISACTFLPNFEGPKKIILYCPTFISEFCTKHWGCRYIPSFISPPIRCTHAHTHIADTHGTLLRCCKKKNTSSFDATVLMCNCINVLAVWCFCVPQ